MRARIVLITAFLLVISTPALAGERPEPLDAARGEAIGRASMLNGPNGLYVSPLDGNVYVASVLGGEITVHDPETGTIVDRIGPGPDVGGPDDIFIADDGTVYWTDIVGGNVGMRRPDGTIKTQFVGQGVNPITMSDDGRLFTTRIFFGQGLYELDPNLEDDPVLLNPDVVGFNGMDFGPDGLLYGPLFFGGAVARIDVDAALPSPEVVATGFRVPGAVAFNPAGELHAVDFAEGQIIKVDIGTGHLEVLADVEGILDNLAIDARGRVFTTAFADGQLLRLDPGRGLRQLNRSGFIRPGGVAVDAAGTVWVADFFSLRGFESTRRPATTFYDRFDPPGAGFATATTVSVDGGNLITTGWFSNSLQIIDPATGAILADIRNLAAPVNAVRHGDELVAAQGGAGNVVNAEDPSDVVIDGLGLPLGLASHGDTLYVSDWALGNVWAVGDGGTELLASGLALPEGLALDGGRLLVVEEAADRVSAIDLDTGAISTVIAGLDLGSTVVAGLLPYGMFNGVAVGGNGSIYVSADGVNQVYEFKRR